MKTPPTKEIKFDRETKDYAYLLNGEVVGFAKTRFQAEQQIDALVYELLTRDNVDAAELTPVEAEEVYASLVELERQAGVVEAQPDVAPAAVVSVQPDIAPARVFLPATAKGIAEAVAAARQLAADARTVRAVNRAYEELLAGQWVYDGFRLMAASRTRPGQRHICDAEVCTCESFQLGGKPCWHRAAYVLVSTAAQA